MNRFHSHTAAILLPVLLSMLFLHGCTSDPESLEDVSAPAGEGSGSASSGLPTLEIDEENPLLLEEPGTSSSASSSLPPLEIDDEAPLLLEEPSEDSKTLSKNEPCHVCHANFKEEMLVSLHAEDDIGCEDCHGRSPEHCNDENNTTPPEIMYPAEAIDESCQDCHDSHDAPAVKVIALWRERGLDKAPAKNIVCTDCHGNHRMEVRTVRWDKKTGELISTNDA